MVPYRGVANFPNLVHLAEERADKNRVKSALKKELIPLKILDLI